MAPARLQGVVVQSITVYNNQRVIMRIENYAPYYQYTPQIALERFTPQAEPQRSGSLIQEGSFDPERSWRFAPGIIVDISQQARDAARSRNDANSQDKEQAEGAGKIADVKGMEECQTCKNRKYVDRSDDSSVSFQSPAHISPGQAASVVMSHEREHVSNEQAKAERDDRKVISQTVALSMSTCPECGRMYVSGGVTRTITAEDNSGEMAAQEPAPDAE